jgi:hypothetical protein
MEELSFDLAGSFKLSADSSRILVSCPNANTSLYFAVDELFICLFAAPASAFSTFIAFYAVALYLSIF